MIRYRAIKKAKEFVWRIEEWDTEFQVSSMRFEPFMTKDMAVSYIKNILLNEICGVSFENEETSEWINGTIQRYNY